MFKIISTTFTVLHSVFSDSVFHFSTVTFFSDGCIPIYLQNFMFSTHVDIDSSDATGFEVTKVTFNFCSFFMCQSVFWSFISF